MPVGQRLRNIGLVIAAASIGLTSTNTAVRADTTLANWGQQSPAQSPAGRIFDAMDYDSRRGRTVMFGGGNPSTNFTDTWEWDGSNWSTFFTTVSPPSSIGPGMAFDSGRGVSVLLDNNGNTWEWNGSSWVLRTTASSPSGRVWTAMAYDSARGRTVLFGGSGSGMDLGDTWTYDGTNWTKMAPATSPTPRFGMAMSFDAVRGVLVLFGGRVAGQRMNDTWEWDGTNWTQRSPSTLPFPRFWHSMAYDAQLGFTVMWGGDHIEPFGLGPINDTWLWDGTNWTRDWTAATPIARSGQAMAYEAATGRIVLFGGSDGLLPGTYYNDTWEFGTGIVTPAGSPSLSFPANMVYFRSSGIGATTSPAQLRIFGAGTGPTLISSITTTADFAVSATDCPIAPNPLAAGASCNVQVTFTPTVCGTVTGSLVFADTTASGSESVALEGGVLSPTCDGDLGLIATKDVMVNATSPAGATISYNHLTNFDEDSTPGPITCSPALNSIFPIGTTTVTCQITDSDDATSTVSATFRVTVNDTDLGLTGVPADITVGAAGPSGTVVIYTAPSAIDEDATTPAVSCSPVSGSTFPIGTTTVTCGTSDSDDTPSSVTATFRVTVGDSDLALSGVPPNVTVQATSAGGAAVGFIAPKALDEDATVPPVTCDHGSGSLFPVGTTTVTCQTTDSDDTPSTVTATFQVTVIDTDLGLSGVPADITVNAAGPSGATVTYVAPTGADEDGGAIAVSCDHASGSTFAIGTTTVTCSVSDSDDTPSTRTATFNVTVNDTDLALTAEPTDITVVATDSSGAVVTYTPPSAIDEDASTPPVTCNRASGSTFPVGTTTVTCQVTDADDNPSMVSASFLVTVIPDLQLAISVSPANAIVHDTVTTSASVTDIGAASRKVTISYSVTFTDTSGVTSTVAGDKAEVTVAPGQTVARSFGLLIKPTTSPGTYVVNVTITDVTGSVSQSGTFNVT